MDLVTHAVVGAVTGAQFGHPVLGACVAVMPDLVLPLKRQTSPPLRYDVMHSLFVPVVLALTLQEPFVFYCWFSHLFLDVFTHGEEWGATLFWPFSPMRVSVAPLDWEFFNYVWVVGLCIAAWWIICIDTSL